MPNDVDMFGRGGLSIAMGNASEEVQGKADMVTGDCDHDGFADAVEKLLVQQEGRSDGASGPRTSAPTRRPC